MIKLDIIFKLLIIGALMYSCLGVDDFEIPNLNTEEPEINSNSNIKAIKSAYDQVGEGIYTFDENDDTIIEGFVVSNDEAGNFYKTLMIQDNYENPTSGIEIMIDLKSYFTKYNFGRKIFIIMSGLSISQTNGKYKIGLSNRNEVENIPKELLDKFIVRSAQTQQIVARIIKLEEFSQNHLGTYVQLHEIQFRNDEIGKTYSGEKFDEFNGDRILIQCESKLTTTLSTSSFADFKSNLISEKKGSIEAVLTKDFYAEKYILVIHNISSILFTDEERCDPDYLNCDDEVSEGSTVIFFENFQEIGKTKELEELGWVNKNVYFGNETFVKRTSQGNVSMQISAYGTEENPLEVWLITPAINLENSDHEKLSFDTMATYDSGSILTVWVSTDFEKSIMEATWRQLDVDISVGPSNGRENNYTPSGKVSLACLSGTVHVAFRYQGGDPGITTTYDIDNIMIHGE